MNPALYCERIKSAVAALVAGAALSACATQVAAHNRAAAAALGATEPCYGIARAGKNDCKTERHVCAGWSRQDRDSGAFLFVPAGTCERLAGGRLDES